MLTFEMDRATRREARFDTLKQDTDHMPARSGAPGASLAQAIADVRESVRQRHDAAARRSEGLAEDSYATRAEAWAETSFYTRFAEHLAAAQPGKPLDLSMTVTDYGFDAEAAETDRMSGTEHVPHVQAAESEHDSRIASVQPLIDRLRAAGVAVDTSFNVVAPRQYDREDETTIPRGWTEIDAGTDQDLPQPASLVAVSGRDWWEDQRANVLAGSMPEEEAQRELAALGPQPPSGVMYLDQAGERVEGHALEVDPIGVERTETEEMRHEIGPLTLVNEREQAGEQFGLEL